MIMEREGRFVASHLGGLAIGLTLITGTALAQPPQLPRFQTSVDVTSVDVTVVDSGGRPVMGLQPADFTVRIQGIARRVVSAEWVSLATPERSSAAPPPPGLQYQRERHRRTPHRLPCRSTEHQVRGRRGHPCRPQRLPGSSSAVGSSGGRRRRSRLGVDAIHRRPRAGEAGDRADGRPGRGEGLRPVSDRVVRSDRGAARRRSSSSTT